MILATTQAEHAEHLRDAVITAFRSSGYRHLWNLECEVREEAITLTGVLPSFYLKQVAQTIAMGIEEVSEVKNLVEVDPD
jgi:hypothetical protein